MPHPPTINADGTISALVAESAQSLDEGALIKLYLPITIPTTPLSGGRSGRYFLARCGAQSSAQTEAERAEQWQICLRKPLFVSHQRTTQQEDGMPVGEWCFYVASGSDSFSVWLHEIKTDQTINLLGPFGNGFSLNPLAQRLLILADTARAITMLGLINEALDAGKKVAVLVKGEALRATFVAAVALAVEVHYVATEDEWESQITPLLRWADQLCTTLALSALPALAQKIRQQRSRLDGGFAQVLVEADLVCGVGACLACVVPIANGGLTRACEHGPVMDLSRLSG